MPSPLAPHLAPHAVARRLTRKEANAMLSAASQRADFTLVREAVAQGADPMRATKTELSALEWACHHGNADACAFLLPLSDPTRRGGAREGAQRLSALELALTSQRQSCVELLLRDPRARSRADEPSLYGITPLMRAAATNNLRATLLLLPVSDPLAQDENGFSALHWAARSGPHCINALLRHSDPHQLTLHGCSALHIAAEASNALALEALLPRSDPAALTPFPAVAWLAHLDAPRFHSDLSLLPQAPAGANALHIAAAAGNAKCVEILARATDPNALGARGESAAGMLIGPLIDDDSLAASLAALIRAGADLSIKDAAGMTPLMRFAAQFDDDRPRALTLLMAYSPGLARNAKGETAAAIAWRHGNLELGAILVTANQRERERAALAQATEGAPSASAAAAKQASSLAGPALAKPQRL